MRTASIDIGTNTIRLLICEQKGPSELKQLYIDRVITRLGEGFSENSRLLTPKAQERTIIAIKVFATIIADYGIDKIRAVATSVVRESSNGREFVNKVQKEAGISIEVISGEEEANLTVLGVLNSVSVNTDNCVIFDIGGGSTEYILIQNSDIASLTSTNLGVVHLTEKFLINDTQDEMKNLSDFVQKTLRSKLNEFKFNCYSNMRLIATAGTPTTLAATDLGLEEYNPELVNNFVLTKSKITSIIESLIKIPRNERIKITGMEKGREDIIITGAIILLETLDYFSASRVVVSDGGVLEGIAHSLIS